MTSQHKTSHRSPLAEEVAKSGVVVTQMLIVDDIARSVRFYRDVLGAEVKREDPPAMLRFHNAWLVLNVGGGPTEDKPDVTVAPPLGTNFASSFLNIRVPDIAAMYESWSERGARFLTPPMERGAELRCYLRDPDGYLIELGQTARP
jgi:catechol 2,3-dioxygenase-like lactoylglutathione lyase family enzyme